MVAVLFIAANVMGWTTGIVGLVLAVFAGMLLSKRDIRTLPAICDAGNQKDNLSYTNDPQFTVSAAKAFL